MTTSRQRSALTGRDDTTGLDHTWFRKYESLAGRWTTPDPMGGNVGNPQSFNHYAYTQNDPINFVDPSGLRQVCYGGFYFGKEFGYGPPICFDVPDFYFPTEPKPRPGSGQGPKPLQSLLQPITTQPAPKRSRHPTMLEGKRTCRTSAKIFGVR
jgi:RHS repeat-associated protein